jgi:predicted Zn-dependent protease with MMP-like domain
MSRMTDRPKGRRPRRQFDDDFKAQAVRLVREAVERIPEDFLAIMENVDVQVRRWPGPDQRAEAGLGEGETLLGLYHGIALTERDSHYGGSLPDTITIYRDALLSVCNDEDEVVEEVRITVIHEIAHYFGIDEDRLHQLGWG